MTKQVLLAATSLSKIYKVKNETEGSFGWMLDLIAPEYEETQALEDVSFSLYEGDCVGLLGANGAGKSTLIKILCGVQGATSGSVSVLGKTPSNFNRDILKSIGVVFGHKSSLWWDLPVRDSFNAVRKIYEIDELAYSNNLAVLIGALRIENVLNTPVRSLSLGERVKCEIAAKLLYEPKILFLDEPTIGLDALAKIQLRQYIKEYVSQKSCAVFLTSHDARDIEDCCNRVLMLDEGCLRYDGPIESLIQNGELPHVLKIRPNSDAFSEEELRFLKLQLNQHYHPTDFLEVSNKNLAIRAAKNGKESSDLRFIGDLINANFDFQLELVRPSLENIVINEYKNSECIK